MEHKDYMKGYKNGFEDGKREALIELQKENKNSDLPSNETLYKIFKLVEKKKEIDRSTSSLYINEWDGWCNYIAKNW